jgi:hydrogenase maturation protease
MSHSTLVLGIGDVRAGDDAVGPRALAELQRRYRLDAEVFVLDGPSLSMRMLPLLSSVRHILLVTGVRLGAAPGTLHELHWEGRPEDLGPRLPAIRRTGIELLRSLHFWVDPVPELTVLGVEMDRATRGAALSPLVALAVQPVIDAVVGQLRRWGHEVEERAVVERVEDVPH